MVFMAHRVVHINKSTHDNLYTITIANQVKPGSRSWSRKSRAEDHLSQSKPNFSRVEAAKCPPHVWCVAALRCETWNLKFNHFRLQLLQTPPKNQYCTFSVIKVQWVTISGLCSHTKKFSKNCIYALAATRKTRVSAADTLDLYQVSNGVHGCV